MDPCNSSKKDRHADRSVNDDKAITAKPIRINRITAKTTAHCPNCGFEIAVGANKYPRFPLSQIPHDITEEEWTTEKLIDEMYLHLMRVKVEVSNGNDELIEVRKYKRKAEKLFWRIAAGKPTPEYIIIELDLTPKIRKELEENTSIEWRQRVLKEAVGRIFEELSFDFYHLSVASNLRVRLV